MGKMGVFLQYVKLAIFCSLLVAGSVSADWEYDYTASIDCLKEPLSPQYGGGLVENPKMDFGMQGWNVSGEGTKLEIMQTESGNDYLVASNRHDPRDSFSQTFELKKDVLYSFTAWIQISKGREKVAAFMKVSDQESVVVGSVLARAGCWSMLKGGFQVYQDYNAELYFLSNNTRVELWVDNISLKDFSKKQWRDHQRQSIDRNRKRKLSISVTNEEGEKLVGAHVKLNQIKPHFLLGASTTEAIIDNKAYQKWFLRRFTVTSFNNELKWYYTEKENGKENYTVPDAMISFFRKHEIPIRGHTILWDKPMMNSPWIHELSPRQLLNAAVRRMGSVMSRYAGKLASWDVINENIHFSFYEDEMRPNASAMFFKLAQALDPGTTMYLNEYATLEYPLDMEVSPSMYVEMLRSIRSFPGNENMVVGLGQQGHFTYDRLNISYVRAALDVLGATKMPIWLTELDTERGPDQIMELEEVLREVFSHPAVEGIVLWAGWKPTGCNKTCLEDKNFNKLAKGCARMCFTDNNFKNFPLGDMVDRLIREWRTTYLKGATNKKGVYQPLVFHGDYTLTFTHPSSDRKVTRLVNVTKDSWEPLEIQVVL
ncbi:endo-1,4-beta-xylanase 5-like [Primulina huaijiensis]|uniref:endo-1,4-beta-xylanase 5-like n=1 Tax=Primulina huaijiensis TaxID=1492673 RepID=UPI003CC78B1D